MTEQLALPMEWCQRWRDRRHSWRSRRDGGFQRDRYRVEPISQADAWQFVAAHHYLGDAHPSRLASFGMSEDGRLVGVAVIGSPVAAAVLTKPFPGLQPYVQSAELSRFVLLDEVPANAETWMLARVFGLLRDTTAIRGVVAFSDPQPRRRGDQLVMPGHWGTIYQAGSAAFLGRATPRTLTVLPDGAVLNGRARSKLLRGETGWRYVLARLVELGATPPPGPPSAAWLREALAEIGATSERHRGCLRYGFPLARGVELGLPRLAYPKRS